MKISSFIDKMYDDFEQNVEKSHTKNIDSNFTNHVLKIYSNALNL